MSFSTREGIFVASFVASFVDVTGSPQQLEKQVAEKRKRLSLRRGLRLSLVGASPSVRESLS